MLSYGSVSIHFFSIILSILCLIIALKHRRKKAAKALSLILGMAILGSVATFGELSSVTFEGKYLWRNILQIGLFVMPAATLEFVRKYTNDQNLWLKYFTYFAFVYQSIGVLLIFTNEYHHIMREAVFLIEQNGVFYLTVKQTLFGKIVGAINTLVSLTAMIRLGIFLKQSSGRSKKQVLLILIGFLIPAVYSYLQLAVLEPLGVNIPTAASFLVGDVMILWGFLRYDLLSVSPLARDWAFNEMKEGVVFGGLEGEILDMNTTAEGILKVGKRELEKRIQQEYPNWYETICKREDSKIEIPIMDERESFYQVTVQPLLKNQEVVGTISVLREITEERKQRISLLQKAEADGLTGILNRDAFENKTNQLIKDSRNGTLLVMDIDYFKQINDTYGHIAGDQVIKEVANLLGKIYGESGLIGRLGGDEFGVFISNIEFNPLKELVNRQVERVKTEPISYKEQKIHVTLSMGGIWMNTANKSFEEFYEKTDELLYRAKKQGRNCEVLEQIVG